MILSILSGVVGLGLLGFLYIKKVPHGYVDFKSGFILKYLPGLGDIPIPVLRKAVEKSVAERKSKLNLPIQTIKDIQIPTRHGDIGARIYDNGNSNSDRAMIYIHGGGWCICSIDTHNEPCRRLAIACQMPVISLEYSLSPEAKFPQAFEECLDATTWIKENIADHGLSAQHFAISGDSAGGNLAIGVTRALIDDGKKDIIDSIVPVYPATDMRHPRAKSHHDFGEGYYLTTSAMDLFGKCYLTNETDVSDLRLSPLAHDGWDDFPPTFILTAGFDPLRDEGEAFGKKLTDAGCNTTIKRYEGAIHAFFGVQDFGSKGLVAVQDIAEWFEELDR